MPTQSSAHFFLVWTKERIDEMDAALASLESKAADMQADSRVKAEQFIADCQRDVLKRLDGAKILGHRRQFQHRHLFPPRADF